MIEAFADKQGVVQTLVLRWVEGRPLRARIDEGRAPAAEVALYLTQGLELLAWLHGRVPPVVHRDISPRNLLVSDTSSGPQLRLVDFGAVKTAMGGQTPTTADTVGTFGYLAPEQLLGQADPRSDLYGLGMSLIALAAGKDALDLPKDGNGRVRLGWWALQLPRALRATLRAMTALDPARRPADAAAALRLLRQGPPRGPLLAKAMALLTALALTAGYVATRVPAQGEVATLGGWFSGHGSLLPAVLATFTRRPRLVGSASVVAQVAFSADGQRLASATEDGEVIVWGLPAGEVLWRATSPQLCAPQWLGLRADGSVVWAGGGKVIEVVQGGLGAQQSIGGTVLAGTLLASGVPLLFKHGPEGLSVIAMEPTGVKMRGLRLREALSRAASISPDGTRVAWVREVGGVAIWQVGSPREESPTVPKLPSGVALTRDAAVVTSFGHVWWGLPTGAKVYEDFSNLASLAAISPDGRYAATSPLYATRTAVLHTPAGVASARLAHRGRITCLAFSPDGTLLAVGAEDQRIKLWRVADVPPP